jgi:hypothetical protein
VRGPRGCRRDQQLPGELERARDLSVALQAAYDRALKAWNEAAAKAKKAGKEEPPNKPEPPEDTQPENTTPKALPSDGDVVDGWKYTVSDGQPITREKDGVVYYMVWLHQATVIRAVDHDRVFVLETTNTVDPPLAPPTPPPVAIPPELILKPDVAPQSTPVPVP